MARAERRRQEVAVAKAKQPRPRPSTHWFIYGDFGMGKTEFLATFGLYKETRPVKVYLFDPVGGQEYPYLNLQDRIRGERYGELQEEIIDDFGIRYRDVYDLRDGELAIRIMIMAEPTPRSPVSTIAFQQEFDAAFQQDQGWKTVGLDTLDSYELSASKTEEYVMNPKAKDPRQWFGGATSTLEETLCMSLVHLKCNLVVLTHINRDKINYNGHAIQGPSCGPGRLATKLGAYFPEIYKAYAVRGEDGQRLYQLQTQPDDMFVAKTHIDVSDPVYPDYGELWTNWDAK